MLYLLVSSDCHFLQLRQVTVMSFIRTIPSYCPYKANTGIKFLCHTNFTCKCIFLIEAEREEKIFHFLWNNYLIISRLAKRTQNNYFSRMWCDVFSQ